MNGRMPSVVALVAALAAGTSGCHSRSGSSAPSPWVDLAPAPDQNPDPHIVEVSIEAREATKTYLPGQTTAVLT
jgi:hypothetical protein